uniref:Uncharacterized protein n=1 Tax=Caenorhabditis japonica TaxID=281687 RepID=A0A8R1I893_CAEJA
MSASNRIVRKRDALNSPECEKKRSKSLSIVNDTDECLFDATVNNSIPVINTSTINGYTTDDLVKSIANLTEKLSNLEQLNGKLVRQNSEAVFMNVYRTVNENSKWFTVGEMHFSVFMKNFYGP